MAVVTIPAAQQQAYAQHVKRLCSVNSVNQLHGPLSYCLLTHIRLLNRLRFTLIALTGFSKQEAACWINCHLVSGWGKRFSCSLNGPNYPYRLVHTYITYIYMYHIHKSHNTYTNTYICTYIHMYIHTYIHTYIDIYTYIHIYTHIHNT